MQSNIKNRVGRNNYNHKIRDGFMEHSRRGSGALPSPAILESYEEIAPGTVAKFVEMVEKEQEYRNKILAKKICMMKFGNAVGQLVLVIMVLAILATAVILVKEYDQPVVASIVSCAGFGFLGLLKVMQCHQGKTHKNSEETQERNEKIYDDRRNNKKYRNNKRREQNDTGDRGQPNIKNNPNGEEKNDNSGDREKRRPMRRR